MPSEIITPIIRNTRLTLLVFNYDVLPRRSPSASQTILCVRYMLNIFYVVFDGCLFCMSAIQFFSQSSIFPDKVSCSLFGLILMLRWNLPFNISGTYLGFSTSHPCHALLLCYCCPYLKCMDIVGKWENLRVERCHVLGGRTKPIALNNNVSAVGQFLSSIFNVVVPRGWG